MKLFSSHFVFVGAVLFGVLVATSYGVVYVNQAAAPGGDGNSWGTAYKYLYDALGSNREIWVAEGVYYPDQSAAVPGGSGLRTDTFILYSGCKIFGGFSGSETSLSQRNIYAYKTVLSGDLNENDTTNFMNHGDNSYHVVYSGSGNSLLDGLTITGGAATETAGDNSSGGGIFNTLAVVKNCVFTLNLARYGGGYYGSGIIIDCVFDNNRAFLSGYESNGGGAYYDGGEITNSVFYGNQATRGGGLFCYGNGAAIKSCTFTENYASAAGTDDGDGLYLSTWNTGGGNVSSLYNCIFWNNGASIQSIFLKSYSGGAIDLTIDYCDIEGASAYIESDGLNITVTYGANNIASDPMLVGLYRLSGGSPCLDAGDNDQVPTDSYDVDNDGDTTEVLPLDADGKIRFVDDPAADTGNGISPIVDIGACERMQRIYVDIDATGADNGFNWGNAFHYLHDALDVASSGDEIWVAEGFYQTTAGGGYAWNDRDAHYELKNDVSIYGGFYGNEVLLEQRDWDLHQTVLTGSIGLVGRTDDSYHVVMSVANTPTAVLDGFEISYGNANGALSRGNGGGLHTNSSPTIRNCRFSNNSAVYGGGLYHGNADFGGPQIINCQFVDNLGSHSGGAIYTRYNDSAPLIVNCLFRENTANVYGGGIYSYDCSPEIINCTFNNNTGTNYAGALDQVGTGTAMVRNSIFWGNTSDQGHEMATAGTSIIDIQYTDVEGGLIDIDIENDASVNWGSGNLSVDPDFADTDLHLDTGSLCIDAGNNAAVPVGITTDIGGNPRFVDDPAVSDSGSGSAPIVDMGAYERINTPVGDNIVVPLDDHNITYEEVETAGNTSVTESSTGTAPPSGFQQSCSPPQYFNIETSATFNGVVHICLSYDDTLCDESDLYLMHYEDGNWIDVTTSVDTGANIICGEVTSLSEFLLAVPEVTVPIIYVDQSALGLNTGTSWENAFIELSEALSAAVSGDEIWVAEGRYLPDTSGLADTRNATFQLINNVIIYGGFPTGGGDLSSRNPDTYETILSGDLDGDDGPDFTNYDENCRHVVTGSGNDSSAVLDGFTITAGHSSDIAYPADSGGGMYNYFGSPTVSKCLFRENLSESRGGGVFNQENSATFTSCTFIGNKANTGGAMNNAYNANTVMVDCVFEGNLADQFGGAIQNVFSSQSDLINCVFRNNTAADKGGAFRIFNSWPIFINCIFEENSAQNSGGAIWSNGYSVSNVWGCLFARNISDTGGAFGNDEYGNIQMANCTFASNNARIRGGAVYVTNNSVHTLRNSILWDNNAPIGTQLAFADNSNGYITYSDIEGDSGDILLETGSTLVEFTNNISSDPQFVANDYNLRLLGGSPCVDAANNADVPGALTIDLDGRFRKIDDPTVTDSGSGSAPIADMGCYERGSPIYVDDTATGSGNGMSWSDAFNDLQSAFDAATAQNEIWVAQGRYLPDTSGLADPRNSTFQLENKVAVYGGFPNGGGNWSTRNPEGNVTILDGDIGTNGLNTDNSYHVVTGSGTDHSAILDGFTIENGYNSSNSGAGVINVSGSPTVTRCVLSQNQATNGGGMFNIKSDPLIAFCTFYQNSTGPSSNAGGGMYNNNSCPVILRCEFFENWAYWAGGAIYNHAGSHALIQNCLFVRNSSTSTGLGGGAIHNSSIDTTSGHTYPVIKNCTFFQNTSNGEGGGIFNRRGSAPIITNCILWDNSADGSKDFSAQIYDTTGSVTIPNFCCIMGWTTAMSGLGNINQDPLFSNVAADDYHLKSFGWRWNDGWDYDLETSRCLDAGNPGDLLGDEVVFTDSYSQNLRINMGVFAGTEEASLPPPNWALLTDVNNDGICDLVDFAELSSIEWMSVGDEQPCDFNRDDMIGLGDLALMSEDFLDQTTWY
jgi:predicted outer membrane repeat protein